MLKTVLEDAKGSRLEGISFGDVKAICIIQKAKIPSACFTTRKSTNSRGGEPCRRSLKAGDRKNTKKDIRGENVMTANRKVTARYAEIARFWACILTRNSVWLMEKKTDLHCASAVLILAGVSSTVWSAYQSVWLRTA